MVPSAADEEEQSLASRLPRIEPPMDIRDMPRRMWAVIDVDTGTIVGPNVVAVPLPAGERLAEIRADRAEAWRLAYERGIPLQLDPAGAQHRESRIPPTRGTP